MYYDYEENVKSDIIDALKENHEEVISDLNTIWEERTKQKRLDKMRIDDSVTWNASWSYTFNSYQARENLERNEELVENCVNEFCIDMAKHWNDYEYLDVSVRCYLLSYVFEDAWNERKEEHTRTCDACWKVFDEGFCLCWGKNYYCSEECLNEEVSEEEKKELDIWGDESDSYQTCWYE